MTDPEHTTSAPAAPVVDVVCPDHRQPSILHTFRRRAGDAEAWSTVAPLTAAERRQLRREGIDAEGIRQAQETAERIRVDRTGEDPGRLFVYPDHRELTAAEMVAERMANPDTPPPPMYVKRIITCERCASRGSTPRVEAREETLFRALDKALTVAEGLDAAGAEVDRSAAGHLRVTVGALQTLIRSA